MRLGVALLFFLLASLLAGRARANSAANFSREPENAGPVLVSDDGVAITVLSEVLEITCVERGVCSFSSVYAIANETDAAIVARGVFYGSRAQDRVRVALDGRALPEISSHADRAALDETFQKMRPSAGSDRPAVAVTSFELHLPPGAHGTLSFAGDLYAVAQHWDSGGYSASALEVRHMVFASDEMRTVADFRYLIFPIRAWRGDPVVDVRIRLGEAFVFTTDSGDGAAATPAWTREGGAQRTRFRASQIASLEWTVTKPAPDFFFGGPTLGIGGRLDRAELRLRAGVEASVLTRDVVEGIHLETDASRVWTIVPSIGAATPDIVVIVPSLGLALGVPVRTEKGEAVRVGGRAELSVQFPLIGVVLPLDYYPAASTRGDNWDVSLMVRFSL